VPGVGRAAGAEFTARVRYVGTVRVYATPPAASSE